MKVFVITNNYALEKSGETGWYFISDSAVTNTGKPFYIPEGKGEAEASVTMAVKINRLGKSVAPKFASRYYMEYAPALHFYLPQYEKELERKGLPGDAARNFDKSLIVGEFYPMEDNIRIELLKNGEKVSEFELSELFESIDKSISKISEMNTLKMGDMVLPGLSKGAGLKIGDLLEVRRNGIREFQCRIK